MLSFLDIFSLAAQCNIITNHALPTGKHIFVSVTDFNNPVPLNGRGPRHVGHAGNYRYDNDEHITDFQQCLVGQDV